MARLDPLTRQAAVPKAQRDAVTLLQSVAVPGTAEAIAALQIPWPLSLGRMIRRLLHSLDRPDANPEAVAREILDIVRDEGLRAPPPAIPPVPVELDEVRLVCFQAVSLAQYCSSSTS